MVIYMSRLTSLELEQEITEQFHFGHNTAYLSEHYNIPILRINRILKRNGVINVPKNMLDVTIDDEKRICELYQKGFSTCDIAEKFYNKKIKCDRTVANILRKNNILLRDFGSENKVLNDSFFEVIDSESKAYYLGFIYADGNIRIGKNNTHLLQIELQQEDAYILEILIHLLQYKSKVKDYENETISYVDKRLNLFTRDNHFKGYSKKYNGCSIQVSSEKIYNDLVSHGVTENKTKNIRLPIGIPNKLIKHFIRGYFDGDGSFTIKRIIFYGQHNLLQFIKDNMSELNLKDNTIFDKKKESVSMLTYGAKSDIRKIFDYFYNDANYYLKRKYQKMSIYVGAEVTK